MLPPFPTDGFVGSIELGTYYDSFRWESMRGLVGDGGRRETGKGSLGIEKSKRGAAEKVKRERRSVGIFLESEYLEGIFMWVSYGTCDARERRGGGGGECGN